MTQADQVIERDYTFIIDFFINLRAISTLNLTYFVNFKVEHRATLPLNRI